VDRAVVETSSDRYVIVEHLAEGGMGAIYLGRRQVASGQDDTVVLKQLLPEYTRDPKFIDLFLREARLSATLDHHNIVRTLDMVNSGNDYYMVMEYVRGGDLRTLLRRARRRQRKLAPESGVFVAQSLLDALSYAHAKADDDGRPLGLIHRDVSPSNILLSGHGEVKLTDFGIAKSATQGSVIFKVKGKIGYMSPEQARGEPVDKRSDLFSLGIVLYEMLVGERLFVGDLMSTAAMIFAQKVSPPSAKRPELPRELDEVVLRALQLEPRLRFSTADHFREALSAAARRAGLFSGRTELAADLHDVCGNDTAQWRHAEVAPILQKHDGTAVISTTNGDVDPFDDDDDDDRPPSGVRPAIPIALELTSVIKLRVRDDSAAIDRPPSVTHELRRPVARARPNDDADEEEPTGVPLFPLRSLPSEPALTPAAVTSRDPDVDMTFSSSEESRGPTWVRPREPAAAARSSSFADQTHRHDTTADGASPPGAAAAPPLDAPSTRVRVLPSLTLSGRRGIRGLVYLMVLLVLICLGVALGVAFSGPELEVVEPQGQHGQDGPRATENMAAPGTAPTPANTPMPANAPMPANTPMPEDEESPPTPAVAASPAAAPKPVAPKPVAPTPARPELLPDPQLPGNDAPATSTPRAPAKAIKAPHPAHPQHGKKASPKVR
jgi:serine/threonine protein kinase